MVSSLDADATVQSPSFTISREYQTDNLNIYHYDFYRLGDEPGIVADEIAEALEDKKGVVITEWADKGALPLPNDRLTIRISMVDENRKLLLQSAGKTSQSLLHEIMENTQ